MKRLWIVLLAIAPIIICSVETSAQTAATSSSQQTGSPSTTSIQQQLQQGGGGVPSQGIGFPFSQQQGLGSDVIAQMQKIDPKAAQAFSDALQSGDMETAKTIYDEFKRAHKDAFGLDTSDMDPKTLEEINQAIKKGDFKTAQKLLQKFQKKKKRTKQRGIDSEDAPEPSIFELTLSGEFPTDMLTADLRQFGYDLFQNKESGVTPSMNTPVSPDYLIGPGDQLTLTLWGTTEGIFNLLVTKEGSVTLPKVGVVNVAGVRFSDIERTLRRHLSRYYTNFNLNVAMGKLKSITLYITGEVANPGSYSVSSLTSVYGALFAAGGPTKKGSLRSIQVVRGGKPVRTIDLYDFLLKGDRSQDINLQHEDTIFVPLIGPIAGVGGSVYRPAIYELKGTEDIGAVIQMAGGIMPIGLSSRLQVARFADNQKKTVIDIKIKNQLPDARKTVPLTIDVALKETVHNMDVVTVLPIYDKVWETVNLQGDVRQPGEYQWRPDMRLLEIVREGQILPTTDMRSMEIIRLTSDFMDRKIISVDAEALLKGDEIQNHLLLPKDQIRVYTTYRDVEKITVKGEVVRPGEYEIYKGERLSDLLRRVGGFTREAYPYGTIFKRKDTKNAEVKNLQSFISKMQVQVIQSASAGTAGALSSEEAAFINAQATMNQTLLNNLKAMQDQFEGRVAITINNDIDTWAGTKDDLLLQNEDAIIVPKRPQEVMVMGEVHSPGARVYVPGLIVKDYLYQTGGLTNYADEDQIYVMQANGFAYSSDSPSVSNIKKITINAGDTVFVPQKVERYAAMRFTKDIIDILFKTAVTIATITVIFP